MEALLADLRILLARQLENLRTLEGVMRRQREALVKRDLSIIRETVSEQEECLARVQAMEADRAGLLVRISNMLGLGPEGITLRELTENLDPVVGAELRSTGETIREALGNIGRVNQSNYNLIEHSLELVHEMLGAIATGETGKRTYGATGGLRPRSQEYTLVDRTT